VARLILKILFAAVLLLTYPAIFAADKNSELLRDGFFINGVDGKLVGPDDKGVYKFVADADISDDKAVIKAGTAVEVLASTGLSKMVENLPAAPSASRDEASLARRAQHGEKAEPGCGFRLWARVTTYRGRNYIFPVYFLPFKQIDREKQAQTSAFPPKGGPEGGRPTINEPNDPLSIPPEILEKLTSGKTIEPISALLPADRGLELKQDHILADRTGYIVKQGNGQYAFVFDALGRNIDKTTITLLPCQTLEKAVSGSASGGEAIRFKAAGIVTKYQDNFYLLLQRTSRVYSNGNFPK
jgi:hypothetical protein